MLDKVRIGIIGCGAIAKLYHIPAIQQIEKAEVVAVADMSEKMARETAQLLNLPEDRVFTQVEDLLKVKEVNAVLILTPNFTHLELVKLAASYGKNIFCQKPMAKNTDECREMIKACEDNNVKLFISFMHRFLPEVQKARWYIENGYIGKIEMARMHNAPGGTATLTNWYYNKDLIGGGVVIEAGVHGIDIIRYLIGEIEEVLFAKIGQVRKEVVLRGEKIYPTNEDHGVAVYKTESGSLVTHEITWSHRSSVDRFSMEIFGTEGSIILRSGKGPLMIHSDKFGEDKSWLVPELPYSLFGLDQHVSFVDTLLSGAEASPSGYDGLRGLEIVETIYQTAKQNGHDDNLL